MADNKNENDESENLVEGAYNDDSFTYGPRDSEKEELKGPEPAGEPDADSEGSSENESSENTSKGSRSSSQPKSIRKLWSNHSYYLPDEISDPISDEFKRLDFELATEHDVDIKKTRHYYPLIAELGLEKLKELENEEVINRIQEIEPSDGYFD